MILGQYIHFFITLSSSYLNNLMQEQISLTIFHNQQTLLHRSSRQHPQHPERILYMLDTIQKLSKSLKGIHLKEIKYSGKADAPQYELVQQLIVKTHGQNYWEFVKEMWYDGIKKPQMYINTDTYFMKDTYHSARQAVRTTLQAVDYLFSDQNQKYAFSLIRPPGHHCGLKSQPHGFSFFNNLGIGLNYAKEKYNTKRIAIVDWDVHHGEGTQKLFYDQSNPLFISIHRYDNGKFFPHLKESSSDFIGEKEGLGYNLNICWNLKGGETKKKGEQFQRQETCGDQEYAYAFKKIVLPVLRAYKTQTIFVSCGFDSAKGDAIGGVHISPNGYAYMTRQLMKMGKKILFVLEGGYTECSLRSSCQGVIRGVTNELTEEMRENVDRLERGEFEVNQIGREGVGRIEEMEIPHLKQMEKI